jgi:hypothetical protein
MASSGASGFLRDSAEDGEQLFTELMNAIFALRSLLFFIQLAKSRIPGTSAGSNGITIVCHSGEEDSKTPPAHRAELTHGADTGPFHHNIRLFRIVVLGEGGTIPRGDSTDDRDWPFARSTRVCVVEALPVQSTASELQSGQSLSGAFCGREAMNAAIADGIAYLVAAIVRELCALGEIHRLQELKAETCGRSRLFSLDHRRRLRISCLCKKRMDMFWQKLKIIRKKGEFDFEIVGVGEASIFILHRPNVRHSINEKGSYHYLAASRAFHTRRVLFA